MTRNSVNRRSFLILSAAFLANLTFAKEDSRNLFVYYTRTLNTHILVSYMQSLIGGDLLRLKTAQNYPKNYKKMVALASKQRVDGILPPLLPHSFDAQGYKNIFLATPLWDMDMCAPMKSFLNATNLSDKNIYLIVTNAGYGLGASIKSTRKYAKGVNIVKNLDYPFKQFERIKPNLFALNEQKILHNKAFDELDQVKIHNFLKNFV